MTDKKQEDHILMLCNVRVAFPQFFEAKQVNGEGKAAFSGTFLLTPDHPDIPKIKAAIAQVAKEKWGAKASEYLTALVAADKVCLHNGDTKNQYEGFAGNFFVTARSPTRPLIIGQDKAMLTEADGKPYSGCYVNAQVALWAQQNTYGKRVNAQLRGVQFLRDGEAFAGGGVANEDDFDAVDASADGEAPPEASADEWGGLV